MTLRAAMPRTGWLATLVLLAAGCYPALDWREVSAADGGFAVLLPGKPRRDTRQVHIGPHALQMTMLSVRADSFLFGAGYARLPGRLDGEERAKLLNNARDALLMNFGPTMRHDPGEVRLGALDGHPCIALNAQPTVEGRALELNARLCVTDEHLYQVVSLAPRDRATEADPSFFLGSLKLLRQSSGAAGRALAPHHRDQRYRSHAAPRQTIVQSVVVAERPHARQVRTPRSAAPDEVRATIARGQSEM